MKLFKAFQKGAYLPAILLAGWFFSSLLLLSSSSFLLWQWSTLFPPKNSEVLAITDQQQPTLPDERIALLEQFLNQQNSLLASQAAVMIEAADTYKFDWRLLPAIAGKESSFGQRMPWDKQNGNSHNAWGWGVYGDKAPTFPSWEEAIQTVAKGLRQEYYNKGYLTPEIIMKKFTPNSDGSWARDVYAFMEQIAPREQQEQQNE